MAIRSAQAQQWVLLAVVLTGAFMAILDVAIVNVAIPSIRDDLHASFGEVELVISAYTLSYACLLITGGRLGDLYGRRNLFIVGVAVFGAASGLCGAAPTPWVLIGARALQGIGGALMYPQARGAAYAETFAKVLPVSALLLLVAALLVRKLPVTPFEASNALLERLPGWSGLAYSMFLMTSGRIGGTLLADVLSHVTERRRLRTQQAPAAPGEFLAFHFHAGEGDTAWLHYLMREALAYGDRPVPYEAERLPVIKAQIEEVRRRQAEGLLPADMDPALLRLLGFALVSYPRLLSQVTRMTTSMSPNDPKFAAAWEDLLRRVGNLLEAAARPKAGAGPQHSPDRP